MAAAENPKTGRSPTRSRLPNPLNVVVEKVGATRAMVYGDVSVESLKELLMSSMSLLPTTKLENDDDDDDGLKKLGSGLRDEEGGSSFGHVEKSDKIEDEKSAEKKTEETIDTEKKELLGKFSGSTEDETMSKKVFEEEERLLGTNAGRKSKSQGLGPSEEEAGEDEKDEEDARKSLPSCSSAFGAEELPFSNNSQWLQMHFGKALVLGLKDVVKKKPQDPVSYLAFWLREYRSKQEIRQRRRELDDELGRKRSMIAKRTPGPNELVGNPEPEFYGDGEEGGENADWNFKNYYPDSEVSGVAPEVGVQL